MAQWRAGRDARQPCELARARATGSWSRQKIQVKNKISHLAPARKGSVAQNKITSKQQIIARINQSWWTKCYESTKH